MAKTNHFESAVSYAKHEIEFLNYELGRMGREPGKKPEHKAALLKILEIVEMYNNEDWETIASMIPSSEQTPKTRKSEIETIRALESINGYFAEYFKNDIAQMVENIRNDFPIEHETSFGNKDEVHRNEIRSICETMLECAHQSNDIELLNKVIQLQGHQWVIRYKLQNEIPLCDIDKKFIINNLQS